MPRTRSFRRGPEVRGNFLRDGAHWEAVRQRVIARFSEVRTSDESASPADKSAKLLIEMPATVSHEVRMAAIAASTRLRTERTLAFGHPVLLSAPGYRLRFEPITARGSAVELPYSFQRDGGTAVNVALRLKAPNDPMAIRYADGTDPHELVRAWVAGLAGFAELTCVAAPSRTVDDPHWKRTPNAARAVREQLRDEQPHGIRTKGTERWCYRPHSDRSAAQSRTSHRMSRDIGDA